MTREEFKRKFGYDVPSGSRIPTNLVTKGTTAATQEQAPMKPKKNFLQKAQSVANVASFGVGNRTGEAIGTAVGALGTKINDLGSRFFNKVTSGKVKVLNHYANYDTSAPSPLQVGADAVAGAFTVAGMKGLKPAGSLLKTSLKEAALDAGAGATTEIANKGKNATAGGVAGQAALWGTVGAVLPGVAKLAGKFTKESRAAKTLLKNTEAVDPELLGKAKIEAYKEVASGRGTKPSTIFQEQGLSPNEKTVNLAKRLSEHTHLTDGSKVSGVRFGKSPLRNLEIVSKSMSETEKTLTNALKNNVKVGDKSLSYHLDKSNLINKLEVAKTQTPREFQMIKDSKSSYDNVMEFAKEKIAKAEDSIMGGREARTAFDKEARKEYPSVFKDGYIDTATPAGNAIKKARELINQHIYEVAPNGSDIQKLVGREADLFNARDISAIKASRLHGKDWWQKFAAKNPKLAASLKWGSLAGLTGISGAAIANASNNE